MTFHFADGQILERRVKGNIDTRRSFPWMLTNSLDPLTLTDSPLVGLEKRKRKAMQPTDKGALYHVNNTNVHEWITHLGCVHYKNPSVMIGCKPVQACDPLAPVRQVLYYTPSRSDFYYLFFEWWDVYFAATFKYTCPFLAVKLTSDLTHLLDTQFETY